MAHEFLPSIQEETLQFMEQIDPATSLVTSTNSSSSASKEIPIDEVHVKGLVHFGAWIFVTDVTNQKVLLLKRGPQLVTCPNSWSLVGEHALGDESPLTTAERGIAEELGIANHNIGNSRQHKQAPVMEVSRLLPYPIYYRRHYGPTNGNRIDRQLTYLWWVRLLRPYQELNNMLTLDEEVADLQWVSLPDLRSWVDRDISKRNTNGSSPPPHLDFCHHTIQELLLLVLDSFESILTNNDNPSS
jgi:8-oxo-dGTP pyrophosphatase MutT (NUDIX family)